MAKRAVLFVDLLGVQKMWSGGGVNAVTKRIDEFNVFMLRTFETLPQELSRDHEFSISMSGDSFAVPCQDFEQAIRIGRYLFQQAFYDSDKRPQPFWIRGVVSSWNNESDTFDKRDIQVGGMSIGAHYVNHPSYMRALAMEKSGFKGMRLVIEPVLLGDAKSQYHSVWPEMKCEIFLISRLANAIYPAKSTYEDILWMAFDEGDYKVLAGIMQKRFRRSSRDTDELLQAAATRLVFDEVSAITHALEKDSAPPSDASQPKPRGAGYLRMRG